MPRYDEEGFSYGAGLRRGDSEAGRNLPEGHRTGRPPKTRDMVHDIIKDAASTGENLSTGQVVDRAMDELGRAGKRGKRSNVQRQVGKILNRLQGDGDIESKELELEERWNHPAHKPGGKFIVWAPAGSLGRNEPDPPTGRTADPMTWTKPEPERKARTERASQTPRERKPDMFDRAAQRHRDYLDAQRDKAPENQGRRGRSGGGGGQSSGGQSAVDRQRASHDANLDAQREAQEAKWAAQRGGKPKGGEDEGGGAGIFKKV